MDGLAFDKPMNKDENADTMELSNLCPISRAAYGTGCWFSSSVSES